MPGEAAKLHSTHDQRSHAKTHFMVGLNLTMGIVALLVSIAGLVLVLMDRKRVQDMHDTMKQHMEKCSMLRT